MIRQAVRFLKCLRTSLCPALALVTTAIASTPALAQPDLVVSSVTPPPAGVEGGIVEISWTVTNQGETAATGNWSDSIFLSLDQVQSPDEFIGAQPRLQTLDPGGSYVQTQSIEIPNGVFGDWYFIIETDSGFQIGEGSNEENNTTAAGTTTSIEGIFPDLIAEILEVPEGGLSGEIPAGVLRWRVTNVGGTTAVLSSSAYDRIFISLDDLEGDDIFVNERQRPVSSLAPGESYERSLSSSNIRLPYDINGDVRWRVFTDNYGAVNEGDAGGEDNNNAFSDPYMVQGGDVQISSFVAPDVIAPGTTTALSWTKFNPGPGSVQSVRFSMWLSVDEIGGNGEPGERLVFANQNFGATLQAGDSDDDTETYNIPSEVEDGAYFFVLVADPEDLIDESITPEGENNNVFARGVSVDSNVFPDLIAEILEVPEGGLSGEIPAGVLRWRVTNVGGTTAVLSSSAYDRIFISLDDLEGDDIFVNERQRPVSSLAPGESYERSLSSSNIRLPYDINGDVRWRVFTDNYGAVNEGDAGGEDNNNAFSDPYMVQGGDVQISSFVAPDVIAPGTTTALSWTKFNPGPGSVQSVRFSMWLSVDEIGGNGEPGERLVFANQNFGATLQAGDSDDDTETYNIPSEVEDGAYYFVLVADPEDLIDESITPEGENNNVFATRPISPDLIISDIVIPSGVNIGDEIQLSWSLQNAGTKIADGPWTDEIIFSTDDIDGNEDDVVFSSLAFSGSLAPGQQITRGISFIVPASAAKSAFMIIRTDATDTVNESREDNNARVEPFEPTGPDLFLASAGVGQSSQSLLEPISVSWVVENQGSAVALGPWVERVYLSSDSVFSPGTDLLLGTDDSIEDIQQGAQAVRSLDLLPPQDNSIAPGDYFVFVDLDSEAGVIEIDEQNNDSEPIAITLTEAITPDLVMTLVSGPTEVAAGGTAEITWTVENQGKGVTAAGWSDSIRLSLDAALGGDIELARVQRGAPLNPNSSYTETATIVIPEEYVGTRRFVVATDADDVLNEFAGEDNNALITSNDVQVRVVDLVVTNTTVPSAGVAGESISISWDSLNQSPATVAANEHWRDRVYLSSDAIIGGADIEVGSIVRVGPQGPSESDQVQASIELPLELAGQYFVVIRTDADNQIAEGNAGELNNSYISLDSIEVSQPSLPDLLISSISSPSMAISGEEIVITWEGQNVGELSANGTWTDRVYLSDDPVFSANDVSLGTDFRLGPIDANSAFSGELTATLPQVTGQRWIIVQSDPDDLVEEGNGEENNSLVATTPITIEAPELPDLLSGILNSPATAESGGSVVVSWQITNPNAIDAVGTWTNALYLSDDSELSSDDQLLRADTFINGTVSGNGGVANLEFSVVMPSTLQDLTAYLIAVADNGESLEESDEGNNASAAVAIDIVAEPSPDLITQSIVAPSAAVFGEELMVTLSGQNTGTSATTGGWADQVFLSSDMTLDESDTFIGIGFQPDPVVDGEPYSIADVTITLPLENSLLPGTYFLVVKTDAFGQISESNESNNVFVGTSIDISYPPLPDFTITSVLVKGEKAVGSTVAVTVNLANVGNSEVLPGTRIELALSESEAVPQDGAFAALTVEQPIPAGGSIAVTGNVVLPDPGYTDAYLVATADSDMIVVELDESNNSEASSMFSFARPDLAAQSVSLPTSATAGDPINIIWEVQNTGAAITRGSWADRIMLSQNPDSTSGRVVLSRVIDFNVAPDTPYIQSAIVTLSEDLEGDFYVIVDADAGDTLIEEVPDASNRVVSSLPISIFRPDRPNLVVSSVTPPTSVISGQSSDLSWRVQNIGSTSTNTIWNDRVYASLDDELSSDDYLIAQQSAVMQLSPGQSYTRTLNAPLPLATGTYKLLVVTDASNAQVESYNGGENDNLGVSVSDFTIAGYSATASASPDSGLAGTPITVSGIATVDGTGQSAAGVPVKVRGRVRGFERHYTVLTLADGSYSATLNPGPTEAGLYTVDAGMPSDQSFMVQDSLVLVGLQTNSVPINVRALPGHESTGTFTVRNLGDLPLGGFEILTEGGDPAIDIQIVFDGGSVLAPLERRTIGYRVNASAEVEGVIPVILLAVSAPGAQAAATLSITVGRENANLVASTMVLREDMVAGENDYVELEIQNIGGAESGPLEVDIAAAPWLTLVSPSVMDSLLPGEEAAVTLRLSPGEDLPLGPYEASPGIVVSDQSDPSVFEEIDFAIENTTNRRGALDVQVTSEFSYFGDPPIYPENAVVTARSFGTEGRYARGGITASGVADANGQISFQDLPEGWYEIEVRAPDHNTYRNNQFVQGADNTEIETFVPRQVVSFDWSVVPIDFVDEYMVNITTVFETNVPTPVVTIDTDPLSDGVQPFVDLTTGFGSDGTKQVVFEITNHGLINAENFRLETVQNERFEIIPLIDVIGDIPGLTTISVPVLIVDLESTSNRNTASSIGSSGCAPLLTCGLYEVVCGTRRVYCSLVWFRQPLIDCIGDFLGGFWVGSNGFGGPGGIGGGIFGGGNSGNGNGTPGDPPLPDSIVLPVVDFNIPIPCLTCLGDCPNALLDLAAAKAFDKLIPIDCVASWPGVFLPFLDDDRDDAVRAFINGLANSILQCLEDAAQISGVAMPWVDPLVNWGGYCGVINDCILNCLGIPELPCGLGDLLSLLGDAARNGSGLQPLSQILSEDNWAEIEGLNPEEQFMYDQMDLVVSSYGVYWPIFPDTNWYSEVNIDNPIVSHIVWATLISIELDSPGGNGITNTELLFIKSLGLSGTISDQMIDRVAERINRTQEYALDSIFNVEDVPQGQSTDFLDRRSVEAILDRANLAVATLTDQGYADPLTPIDDAVDLVVDGVTPGQGVCVQVTIRLEQRIAFTRSAFRASLGLNNPVGRGSIKAIGVSLVITDASGNDANDLFLIEAPELEGIADVSGSGSLPEGASGRANWRIIPSDFAAPAEDTPYYISGEFQYSVDGNLIVVPLVPSEITVMPNASLDLKYFVERDVFGDDPFTPEEEPSLPYNLGLLMTNQGAGEAREVRIAAAEPRIIENDRGLIIDFDLIGTQVGAEETSPSLNIELGNLAPGDRQVARWLFTSTLQGEFVEFEAEYVSLNGFNTPEFSLIDGISIYEMDHPVQAGAYANSSTADDDALFDFLTNQMPDLNDLPDRLHQSSGAVDPVTPINDVDATIQDSFTAEIDVAMPDGWTYIRVNDPFNATLPLQSVERSDGKVILPNFNVWQTDRIQRQGPNAGQPERYVHIFDRGGSGQYTFRFSSDATPPAVLAWGSVASHGSFGDISVEVDSSGITSEPRSSGLSMLQVTFDEPIDPATFQPINVIARGLDANGTELDLGGIAVETELDVSGTFGTIRFMPGLPDIAKYCITLNDVRDEAGNVLQDNAQIILTALQGDANGDRRVNGADVAFVREIRAQVSGGLIDPLNSQQVRADITGDGRVNGADVSFTRASNGGDTRAIADPCFLPDGLGPFRDGMDASGSNTNATNMSGENQMDGRDLERFNDESKDWQPIETQFAPDGVSIRVDPRRFVVGASDQGVDAIALLLDSGVSIDQISMLGFEEWILVELPAEDSTESLRNMLGSAGVYTSALLRDDADEFLIPQASLLVKFSETTPEDWRLKVLATQFGDDVVVNLVGDTMPGLLSIALGTYSGDSVIDAANRLTLRKDIEFVEPDFIMFANRVAGRSGSAVDSVLTAPMILEPQAIGIIEEDIDVVMLDDGLMLSVDMPQGETVFGGINTMGEPEALADVFGQAVFGGLSVDGEDAEVFSMAIRGMASLNSSGRSVTTTLALAQSLDRATQLSPKIVAISAAIGFQSKLLNAMEAKMLREGVVLIRSTVSEEPNLELAAMAGALLQVPVFTADKNGVHDPALETADRIGQISASLLAADSLGGDVSLAQLAKAVAQQLATDSEMESLTVETLPGFLDLIGSIADRMAIDLNGDGQITKNDFVLFVKRFELADDSVDFDGNGQIDQNDMIEYLQEFETFMAN